MDEDLETFIRRYKAKIIDKQKPLQMENFTYPNQMTGVDISKHDIGDSLQQKWNHKLPSPKNEAKVKVFPAKPENNDFLSKLGIYEEKRRQLQALRKEEYNKLMAEDKKKNQKRLFPTPEFESYENILEKKRQEEREYRRIHSKSDPLTQGKSLANIFSDTSVASNAIHQIPKEEVNENTRMSKNVTFDNNIGTALQIGNELAPEEIQKKKEIYRKELEKQIAESEDKNKRMKSNFSKPQQPITTITPKINTFDQLPPSMSSSSSTIQLPPNPNPPPQQNLNFQSLHSLPLVTPAPFYGSSLVPILVQQPAMQPTIFPSVYPPYMGAQQMPYALNQSNGSIVTSGHFLPPFLRLQDNQSNSPGINIVQSDASQVSLNSLNLGTLDHNDEGQPDQSNNKQQQQQQQQAGVLEAFLYGTEDKSEAERKKKKYQQELKKQMEEDKRKKLKQKEDDEKYEKKVQDDVDRYHAQKDALKKSQNIETAPQKEIDNSNQTSNQGDKSESQNQLNYARGGNGIFGEPMSDEQRQTKVKYQEDLLKQMEDKKRRDEEEKERKVREDELFLKKVEEDKKKMEEEYEKERRKAREKKEAVSVELPDFPLESKRREAEAKMMEEKVAASKRRNTIVKNQKAADLTLPPQENFQTSNTREESPPIPALRSSGSKENQQQQPISPFPESVPVLNLLSKMKKELDVRMENADKLIEKIRHEANFGVKKQTGQTPQKLPYENPHKNKRLPNTNVLTTPTNSPKVKFGIGTPDKNSPIGENISGSNNSDTENSILTDRSGNKATHHGISTNHVERKTSNTSQNSKIGPDENDFPVVKIKSKNYKIVSNKIDTANDRSSNNSKNSRTDESSNKSNNSTKASKIPLKFDKSVNTSILMNEVIVKEMDESRFSSPLSVRSSHSSIMSTSAKDDDYEEDELFEKLVKKKKEVDTKLKKALNNLENLSRDTFLATKPVKKASLQNFFSAENMTDEERIMSARSTTILDKFKEIDQRPFSVHSLNPDELSRQNEERLRRLKIITNEILTADHESILDAALLTPGRADAEYFSWLQQTES